MKHKTYTTIYEAHLGNVDGKALEEAREEEPDHFHHNLIDLMLGKRGLKVPWDVTIFTNNFRNANPRERLDETVFAFILRIVNIIKEERYFRTFRKPESHDAVMAWEGILRRLILVSFALLYNVRWTTESVFTFLEPAILKLLNGADVTVFRELMQQVGIKVARDTPYQAEQYYDRLNFLHVGQYSSFYWRFLHWMAEAYTLQKDEFYKKEWLSLISHSLYRTLRCGICMFHFKNMIKKLEAQLTDPREDFPKLWFSIHNQVHDQRRKDYPMLLEPDYTESEYAEDRAFMLQALSP